jgi:predicted metal-dependent hydrolase
MARHHIAPFIDNNRKWIVETHAHMMAARGEGSGVNGIIPATIQLSAVGQSYTVNFQVAEKNSIFDVEESGGVSVLELSATDHECACKVLQDWLSRQARKHLPPMLDAISCDLGIPYKKVSIRAQKTRWGSCSSRGVISLNRALLLLEPELVRYLLIHELCHRVHMNHSCRFWQLVSDFSPGFRAYEKRLNRASLMMPLWIYGKAVDSLVSSG